MTGSPEWTTFSEQDITADLQQLLRAEMTKVPSESKTASASSKPGVPKTGPHSNLWDLIKFVQSNTLACLKEDILTTLFQDENEFLTTLQFSCATLRDEEAYEKAYYQIGNNSIGTNSIGADVKAQLPDFINKSLQRHFKTSQSSRSDYAPPEILPPVGYLEQQTHKKGRAAAENRSKNTARSKETDPDHAGNHAGTNECNPNPTITNEEIFLSMDPAKALGVYKHWFSEKCQNKVFFLTINADVNVNDKQNRKDLQRDVLVCNGRLFSTSVSSSKRSGSMSCGMGSVLGMGRKPQEQRLSHEQRPSLPLYDTIILNILEQIDRVDELQPDDQTTGLQNDGILTPEDVDLCDSPLVNDIKVILSKVNRTNSGGLAFSEVYRLFGSHPGILIAPNSDNAKPMDLIVGPASSKSASAIGRAHTQYRIISETTEETLGIVNAYFFFSHYDGFKRQSLYLECLEGSD